MQLVKLVWDQKIGVRSILLALSFRVKKVKKYVAHYLPVAERILCLISGFSRKTDSAPFKALFSPATPKFISCRN